MNYTIKFSPLIQHLFSKPLLSVVIFAGLACSPQMIILQQKPEWAKGGYHYYVGRIEKKLLRSPDDPVLLQKGCEALTQYTFGFIMEEADRLMTIDYNGGKELYSQANEHFNQAVQYGNKSLMLKFEKYDGWISNQSDLTPKFTDEDVPNLFWTAAAYGGAIKSSRGNPEWVILLPRVGQLLETALTIDSNWNKGAIYSAMISYTMSRPDPPNKKESIAEDFFKKAVIASNGLDLGPYVTLAESVMISTQNRNEFTNLLYKALNIDMKADPDLALANQINRNRAQWLMDNIDEFFY
ncbi:MAG: TRAP transporter TatT component family protein [Candidatus Marinimicrobia bacterium]|nr:TRAP transporter TatT component family protein [Candidatus Neomarinimicrobiota bacterium]